MGCCGVCDLEFPERGLVVVEMGSPNLSGGRQVRLRLSFCSRCWRDPDSFERRRLAFDALRRNAIVAGADALWKRHYRILGYPAEAALP